MNILVTGGLGKVGRWVVAELIDSSAGKVAHHVTVLDLAPGPERGAVKYLLGDIQDLGQVMEAMVKKYPKVISLHLKFDDALATGPVAFELTRIFQAPIATPSRTRASWRCCDAWPAGGMRNRHRAICAMANWASGWPANGWRRWGIRSSPPTTARAPARSTEAQRIKLVTELSKVRPDAGDAAARPGRAGAQKHTLYVLDEPTVGLHIADVEKLVRVLHRLVGAGNTVVVIEHNLDVIKSADWVVDLGPEGGDGGGRVVAQCAPQTLLKQHTHTGEALRRFLAGHGTT